MPNAAEAKLNYKQLKKSIMEFTKTEKSLLLFLETCAVDNTGKVNVQHMNKEDMDIASRWTKDGFLEFGRICSADSINERTHYVILYDEAWTKAHEFRKERGLRMLEKKNWRSTKEFRKQPISNED
jgi:predicted metalloenzyme YecM